MTERLADITARIDGIRQLGAFRTIAQNPQVQIAVVFDQFS